LHNTAIGYQSLYSNTSATGSVAIGAYSLYSNTTANNNTAIGAAALYTNTTGLHNTAIGYQSLYSNTSATGSVAIGAYSLYSNTTANNNTAIGAAALYTNTTGSSNIAIGNLSAINLTTGSSNIVIGNQTSASSATVSNEIVIGNSATGLGTNTAFIYATSGFYAYIPYSINLWNNNAATVSQVEQWTLFNTANSGIANIGTTPTITSGVLTNIPVGVYNFNITGSLYGSNQTYYPTLQYQASGGSFVRVGLSLPSFGGAWTCPIAITANIRISNVNDAVRLWYDTGTPYNNTGTVPALYYSNYLPRYMTITFISL
jgi:trimeric autotransporter adhesin